MLPSTSSEFKKQTLEADVAAAGDCDGGVEGLLLLLNLGVNPHWTSFSIWALEENSGTYMPDTDNITFYS